MKIELLTKGSPALGCLMGTAYQKLLGELGSALKNAGLDITAGEYIVLRAIYSREGMQQCEIAEIVGKDKAAVCRLVSSLEKKGLIRTESVSYKCLRVYASEKGWEMEPRILSVAQLRHQALADIVAPDELEIFAKVLNKIVSSFKIE